MKPLDTTITQQVLEVGARLTDGPSQQLISSAFAIELDAQLPLLSALNQVDLAHTLVLAENKVIPFDAAQVLIAALLQLNNQSFDFTADPAAGDIYTNRESWLLKQTQSAAWLGAGRARREAITTAYSIKLRDGLLELADALIAWQQSLIHVCETNIETLMPDYTYLQQAQPSSFGHYLLGFAYPVQRDLQRIDQLYQRMNLSPAGCGSSNGSRLPQSRERLAQLLGFSGLVIHARDAMWQADLQIELSALLSSIIINLDRLAEDLQIFSSEEFALIELHDCHARASKIMPQKKNPFALTYIRGLANHMIGSLSTTAASSRTPSGQPDNRLMLYGLIPEDIDKVSHAVKLMMEVISLLKFNHTKAQAKFDNGFLMATDLAEVLVLDCGLSFRDAHHLVSCIVRDYHQAGSLQQLTAVELADYAESQFGQRIEISNEMLDKALNPNIGIASRNQVGGAAPQAMADMISQNRQQLQEIKQCFEHYQAQLVSAEQLLSGCLDAFIDSPVEQ